ncbi:MAG TPA: hypothetical protein VEL79_10940 [Vicinamibacterales bacterium]|nr:hypothetical protein [Vicinamibacterales bacterium]
MRRCSSFDTDAETPIKLAGPDHPTLKDPSLFDTCAWCLHWIPEDAPHVCAPLELTEALSAGRTFVELLIDSHVVIAIVPGPDWDPDFEAVGAVAILCSDACRDALYDGIRRDEARARGETVLPRDPTEAERSEAEALLKELCAWCLRRIADDAPVLAVFAALAGKRKEPPGFIAITMAGRRVPGFVPEPGSSVALEGYDVGLVVCSASCAGALRAAALEEKVLSRIH